jgi:hypothetical protein
VFTNFDAGTELIQSRNMVPIPHRYMRHFIGGAITPPRAWETAGGDIMNNNDQVACSPLLNFLRLACTRNVAGDGQGPVARPVLEVPLANAVLTRHRTELVDFKLPGLNRTPILAAGQQVTQSLGELVAEQWAARQDVINRHALSSVKTINEYFGASTHTLLRLCQVPNTVSLPPVYQKLADYGKKKERITIQREVDDMMNQLGMSQLHFVITADLATKLSSLMWKAHPEDLLQGIHPFCVGEISPDVITELQELARKYDLISTNGASPSLSDAQELVGTTKAYITKNLISLDAQNQLFLVLLSVFLGPAHAMTIAWTGHTMETEQNLLSLQLYRPKTPRHQLLLPALIQRWTQLRFSYWVELQRHSLNNIAPPSFDELWMHITLQLDWESALPNRYLAALPEFSPGDPAIRLPLGRPPIPPTHGGAPPAVPPAARPGSESERCTPYLDAFAVYRATGTRVRDIIQDARQHGHALPQNDAGGDMCVSYHVKGTCSTTCGRRADHATHTAGKMTRLKVWCILAFPGA